jgi:hypothetical protein
MTTLEWIEKAVLTVAVVAIVTALIFTNRVDATSGLAYIVGVAGLSSAGTLVAKKLGQPTAATGSVGGSLAPTTGVPATSPPALSGLPNVPLGGPGTIP